METSKDIGDAFEEITKGIVACTDADRCLIWIDIAQNRIVEV